MKSCLILGEKEVLPKLVKVFKLYLSFSRPSLLSSSPLSPSSFFPFPLSLPPFLSSLPPFLFSSPPPKGTQSDTTILDKFYDHSAVASLTKPSTHTPASAQYNTTSHGWWDCISLPESLQALGKLQLPRLEKDSMLMSRYANREGMSSPSLSSPGLIGTPSHSALGALLSPTSKKGPRLVDTCM